MRMPSISSGCGGKLLVLIFSLVFTLATAEIVLRFASIGYGGIPIDGHPAAMHEIVGAYNAWLQQTDVPKLLFHAQPGAIVTPRLVRWCQDSLKNLETVDLGEGIHYLQEDHPRAIGEHVARWYQDTVQAGG